MGDSSCLMMQPLSHSSVFTNDATEGNPIHALGQSVSFGRFVSEESLSWEKWSSFSRRRYVEEAEKYSRPGSVAEKKAFFEAHYKKMAEKKAAALLEQANADSSNVADLELEGDESDFQEIVNPNQEVKNLRQVHNLGGEMEKNDSREDRGSQLTDKSVVIVENAKDESLKELGTDSSPAISSEALKSTTSAYPSATPLSGKRVPGDHITTGKKTGQKRRSLATGFLKFLSACKSNLQSPKSSPPRLSTKGKTAKGKKDEESKEPSKWSHSFCFCVGNSSSIRKGKERAEHQMKSAQHSFPIHQERKKAHDNNDDAKHDLSISSKIFDE
ncbi:uncharacterized protein LOC115672862 isoform X2 [Syzygium oleosum]|uniref:uncharacterized protein LOC115672862 isoform X2 n=1 Tax=Syzygium oleosum TaxID=219896 RepID=UPI0011D1E824|nr:uncharacterized protein LOC115672862 isoform X2 [Syzygium oleosum]